MNSVDSKILRDILSKFSSSVTGSTKCSKASKQVNNSICPFLILVFSKP